MGRSWRKGVGKKLTDKEGNRKSGPPIQNALGRWYN